LEAISSEGKGLTAGPHKKGKKRKKKRDTSGVAARGLASKGEPQNRNEK